MSDSSSSYIYSSATIHKSRRTYEICISHVVIIHHSSQRELCSSLGLGVMPFWNVHAILRLGPLLFSPQSQALAQKSYFWLPLPAHFSCLYWIECAQWLGESQYEAFFIRGINASCCNRELLRPYCLKAVKFSPVSPAWSGHSFHCSKWNNDPQEAHPPLPASARIAANQSCWVHRWGIARWPQLTIRGPLEV